MFDGTLNLDPRRISRQKSTEYHLYFAAGFLVALPIAAVRCLGRLVTGRRPGGVIAEARAMTNTVIPFVFMS